MSSDQTETKNNNQSLIDGLRKAADFFESRPALPVFRSQSIFLSAWNNKEVLKQAARHLGSFSKEFRDIWFELHKPINEAVKIVVTINREQMCRKIVMWDCPDDAALLRLTEEEAEKQTA